MTVREALALFQESGNPFSGSTDPYSAGNGSMMRLAPVVLFYFPDRENIRQFAVESSRTTHAAQEAIDCCVVLAHALGNALNGAAKEQVLHFRDVTLASPSVAAIAQGEYRSKSRAEIRGSGYSVASLEAAFWCFHHTHSFEEAVLVAANLGDDADTTAAIVGQLAGAHYAVQGIPLGWLGKLWMRDEIEAMADAVLGMAQAEQ